jgi:outer membrane protein
MIRKVVMAAMVAAFVLPVTAISSLAQDLKIGYIDSIKIFADYKETQEAERQYKREVDKWTAEKNRMEQDITRLRDELQAQSLMLSEEKKQEKRLELDRQMQEYQRFMQETFGDDGLAAKRNKELTQPIVDKINKILEDLAKERGLMMVFDVANADIVYADKSLDLTEAVVAILNQQQ